MSHSLLPCIIALPIVLAGTAIADVAEEYERYVDATIGSSKEIAANDAYIRELAVFVDRASSAQSHLSRACDASVHATYYLSSLGRVPLGSGSDQISVEASVEELFRTSQAINFTAEVVRHLDRHQKIKDDVFAENLEASRFECYNVKSLGIVPLAPPNVGVFDSVYAEASFGESDDGGNSGGLLGVIIQAVDNVVQAIKNIGQRKKLRRLAERLRDGIVSDREYRDFARQAWSKIVATHGKRTFDAHAKLTRPLRSTFSKVDTTLLQQRLHGLKARLEQHEDDVVARLMAQAERRAAARLRVESERLRQQRLISECYERVNLNRLRLKTIPLLDATSVIDEIQADLALLVIYASDDKDVVRFVADVRASLSDWPASARKVGQ
jgi:hypothetical protein